MSYSDDELVQILLETEGYDDELELMERCVIDSTVPSICSSCGALGSDCEPDARNYECEDCGELTRSSAMMFLPF